MRPTSRKFPAGNTMIGFQMCIVVKTRNGEYPLGTRLIATFGWRNFTKFDPKNLGERVQLWPLPDMGKLPASLALGIVGMPGATAYFGFLNICQPKEGDTVLVNTAAGAVGSVVGQIAKLKGCKVIGYTGSDAKVAWLKEIGFDYAYNYKTQNLDETLKEAAPDGVDCYFDNVGGTFSDTVYLNHMRKFGRISICGAIDSYNDKEGVQKPGPGPKHVYRTIASKELRVEGFIVSRWAKDWYMAFKEIIQWINEGKLVYREHITEGFENMPKAFFGLLKGENTGKAIVKA